MSNTSLNNFTDENIPLAPAFGMPAPPIDYDNLIDNSALQLTTNRSEDEYSMPDESPIFGQQTRGMYQSGDEIVSNDNPELSTQDNSNSYIDEVGGKYEAIIQEIIDSFQENDVRSVTRDNSRQISEFVKNKTSKTLQKGTILYATRDVRQVTELVNNVFSLYEDRGIFFTSIRDLVLDFYENVVDPDEKRNYNIIIDTYIITEPIVVQTNYMKDKYMMDDSDIIYTETLMAGLDNIDSNILSQLFFEKDLRNSLAHTLFDERIHQVYQDISNFDTYKHELKYLGKFNRYYTLPVTYTQGSVVRNLVHTEPAPEQGALIYLTNTSIDNHNGYRVRSGLKFISTSNIDKYSSDYMEIYLYLHDIYTVEKINKAYLFEQHEFLRCTLFEQRKTVLLCLNKLRDGFKFMIKNAKTFEINDLEDLIQGYNFFLFTIFATLYETKLSMLMYDIIFGEYEYWAANMSNNTDSANNTVKLISTKILQTINDKILKIKHLETVERFNKLYNQETWSQEDIKELSTYFTGDIGISIQKGPEYLYTLPKNYDGNMSTVYEFRGAGPTAVSPNSEYTRENNADYTVCTFDENIAKAAWSSNNDGIPYIIAIDNLQKPLNFYEPLYTTKIPKLNNLPNMWNFNFKLTHKFDKIYQTKDQFTYDKYPCSPGKKVCNQVIKSFNPIKINTDQFTNLYILSTKKVKDLPRYSFFIDNKKFENRELFSPINKLPSGNSLLNYVDEYRMVTKLDDDDVANMIVLNAEWAAERNPENWPPAAIAAVAAISSFMVFQTAPNKLFDDALKRWLEETKNKGTYEEMSNDFDYELGQVVFNEDDLSYQDEEENFLTTSPSKISRNKPKTTRKSKNKQRDPKFGTGKKPKGSGRRLYTNENPKDTVSIKYATPSDARATVKKVKNIRKPFARKIQILTVMEQRARVAGKTQQEKIAQKGKDEIRKIYNKPTPKRKSPKKSKRKSPKKSKRKSPKKSKRRYKSVK